MAWHSLTIDRVNHGRLMMKISEKVKDKKVLLLIRKYLQSGVMENGLVKPTSEGADEDERAN